MDKCPVAVVQCPAITPIVNATTNATRGPYGTRIMYTCTPRPIHRLADGWKNKTVRCNKEAVWVPATLPGTCKRT